MRITTADANVAAVSAALRDEMTREYDVRQADALLDKALAGGTALLLFDGLDEVPLVATPGVIADRLTTLQAVRAFAELHGAARVVLTCRTRAFTEPLCTCLDWPTKTIASFTLGQIRHFVVDWFATLIERGWIARGLGEANQASLIDAIVRSKRLRAMAENPLLTMMAIILTERGELPRDRPLLYEHILEQLLGQWDQQKGGQSLTDIIGAPNLHVGDLRAILDEISYKAHASATERDGRGRLVSKDLRYALAEFLEKMRVAGAWEAAGRCLVYFIDRSGLLSASGVGAGESSRSAHRGRAPRRTSPGSTHCVRPQLLGERQDGLDPRAQRCQALLQARHLGPLRIRQRQLAPARQLLAVQPQIALLLSVDLDHAIDGGQVEHVRSGLGLVKIAQLLVRALRHAVDRPGDQRQL